ncbi:MAG: DedA family protein [Alistipes sp.]|nr:DedA family protein [Alistipes sp.]
METLFQAEWLLDLGYWGLVLGTFIAGTIVSLSSDVLLLAVLLAGGDPWLCLAAATVGNGSGAMISYLMGWFAKWEWLEKWFRIKEETLERQRDKVRRWGVWCALFSWVPVVGQVFMITLGFYKVRPLIVTLLTYVGCLFRFLTWVLLYIRFGDVFVEWISGWLP